MGELTKPQYVQIDNTACDHVQAGVVACRRCLKVCETWAIAAVDQTITLNPYLCQGCGDCATVCPTGAFAYAYPPLEQALLRVGVMLRVYAEQGGKTPIVLLHDGSKGRDWVLAHRAQLPINVLTYSIEALGATGMEFWLMVLAQGAAQVLILDTGDMHAKTRLLLQTQLKAAQTIVQALGYPANLLRLVEPDAVMATMLPVRALRRVAPLPSDVGVHDKRSVIRCAIQHLQAGTAPPTSTPLPEGSFFGAVRVDTKACTRCLDCVALCPESALVAAEDGRGLAFIEARCIQCDGCVSGCPEQAIQLEPRYLFDLTAARSPKVIMSDQVI
jgi:ferredoxin